MVAYKAAGSNKAKALRQPPYVNERRGSAPAGGVTSSAAVSSSASASSLAVASLGASGLRTELVGLEEAISAGLVQADEAWTPACSAAPASGGKASGGKAKAGRKASGKAASAAAEAQGPRAEWLKACREAKTAAELAPLVLQLEALLYSLQRADDLQVRRLPPSASD